VRRKTVTAIGTGGLSSGQLSPLDRREPAYKILKKTNVLEIVKRAVGISSGLQRIRNWALWRGRPLRNGKRNPTERRIQ
jgi:hypothetical protein